MRISPTLGRRLAALIVVGFLGFLLWRLFAARGSEVDLVYDLSRLGRTDLVLLRAEIRRDSELVRSAEFRYPRKEAMAPTQQRHRIRLPNGSYTADFVLQFGGAPERRATVRFSLPQEGPVLLPVTPGG
jgi:hypothetical protein